MNDISDICRHSDVCSNIFTQDCSGSAAGEDFLWQKSVRRQEENNYLIYLFIYLLFLIYAFMAGETPNGHTADFTHEDQFPGPGESLSVCGNSCMMSVA